MTAPDRISRDVLARYAADAAQDVEGVRRLVPDRLRRHGGVRITDEDDVAIEVHVGVKAGVSIPALGHELQQRIAEYLERMTGTSPSTVDVVVHEIGARRADAGRGPDGRDAAEGAVGLPRVRVVAVARRARLEKDRWRERAESEWGAWGTLYVDGDGHLLGSMQYGPATLFPRAAELPAGPPSSDAVLVTCAYLADPSTPWVMQSLFLAAIGDARDRGAAALETFSYAYRDGESMYERFLVHRTVFPHDFLADLGFRTLRTAGRIELVRLEFGGLQPVLEGSRASVLARLREVFAPAKPVPVPRP